MQTGAGAPLSQLEDTPERPLPPNDRRFPVPALTPPPLRRRSLARLVFTLVALLLIAATLGGASFGYFYAVRSDEQREIERREALLSAVKEYQFAFGDTAIFDPRFISLLARSSGLKDLRFEFTPEERARALQPVTDRNGRIIGWFSWDTSRPMTLAMRRLWPLGAGLMLCFVAVSGIVLRQIRRAARELVASEAETHRIAHDDLLTGLPNDRRMLQLLDEALARRKNSEIITFAFFNLESFNEINSALGRAGADAVLKQLGERLHDAMPEHTVVGRFGSDEFAAILVSDDAESPVRAMRAAMGAVARPIWLDQMILVGISAGMAQAPRDGLSRDVLIRRADLALLASKRRGHGLSMRFEPELENEVADRHFLRRELKRAITDATLRLHYQPIVRAAGSRLVGVEALLRWNHPIRGDIPPAVFIPVAEASGMMDELGAFVLRQALTDARRWPELFVAINLSPIQVRDRALVHQVTSLLTKSGVDPSRIVLEITEGVLIESPEDARARLQKLRALGLRIALDDFGSGYSSLSYLQRFPIDKLKIDKGFVEPLGRTANGGAIIQAIVALGRALGLSVLVEGVETEEQRVLLRLAGCDEMQGFLFSKAVPRERIDQILAAAHLHNHAEQLRGGHAIGAV
jgi:diguanylate cyclase (GGDEF)-like protein